MKLYNNILKMIMLFALFSAAHTMAVTKLTINLAANFYAQTCKIDAPSDIIFEDSVGSGRTSVSKIASGNVTKVVTVKVIECASNVYQNTSVFISKGDTLIGNETLFNSDPNGKIGVQIVSNGKVKKVAKTITPPPADSIIFLVQHDGQSANFDARLICKNSNCTSQDLDAGPFSAAITLSFYSD